MILIDALYINNSGGLELLKYLVNSLEKVNANVFYIFDIRASKEFEYIHPEKKCIMKPSIICRLRFYKKNRNRYDKVLCFANIPPPISLKSTVYTYFHNINLLIIPKCDLKHKLKIGLKRTYILSKKTNTDYWIVQTENTRSVLSTSLSSFSNNILLYPFYEIKLSNNSKNRRNDYVFVANYIKEKNHLLLLEAWEELYKRGYKPTLHLTLSNIPSDLENKIRELINNGVKIINHGFIPKNEIWNLYALSKATIYPSLNESFGLGIIEALSYECDIIGPDLPYIHSICEPSCTFDLNDINSLVDAIIKYESNHFSPSVLLVKNQIKELISVLL